MALCEAAAWYSSQGKNLCRQMETLFETYGYYREDLVSVTLKGIEGGKMIQAMMEGIRRNPPLALGDFKVLEFRDYEAGTVRSMEPEAAVRPTGLPASNVLYFRLEQEAWCCIRPSVQSQR